MEIIKVTTCFNTFQCSYCAMAIRMEIKWSAAIWLEGISVFFLNSWWLLLILVEKLFPLSLLSRFKATIVYVWLEHYCYNLWLFGSVWFKIFNSFIYPIWFNKYHLNVLFYFIKERFIQPEKYLEHTWLWIFIKLNSFWKWCFFYIFL